MLTRFGIFFIALLCFLAGWGVTFAEISEQAAIEAANKVIANITPSGWTTYVDKDLRRWEVTRSAWEKSSKREKELGRADTDFGPWLTQMESALSHKRVWAVVYKLVLPPGERAFHTNAMVFVDADSGTVLALIEPEGSPRFPK